MIQYVITGCAGSGTGWGHKIMTELGSKCDHQGYFTTSGIFSRPGFEGDSSWCAIPHLDGSLPTLMLIRNPLQVVQSIDQLTAFLSDECGDPASQYVLKHQPNVWQALDRPGRILRYVAGWDRPKLNRRLTVFLLEDITPSMFTELFWILTGRQVGLRQATRAMRKVGSNFNSHHGPNSRITWDDIRDHPDGGPVIAKAQRWGYL